MKRQMVKKERDGRRKRANRRTDSDIMKIEEDLHLA